MPRMTGGFLDIAVGALQGRGDQLLLHFLEGHPGGNRPGLRGAVLGQKREVLLGEDAAAAGHHGALDGIFEFADVAGPVVVHAAA